MQTGESNKRVHEMVQQMEEFVQNSHTRANSIVAEKISSATADTFGRVKTIAHELLELSKIEKQKEE